MCSDLCVKIWTPTDEKQAFSVRRVAKDNALQTLISDDFRVHLLRFVRGSGQITMTLDALEAGFKFSGIS